MPRPLIQYPVIYKWAEIAVKLSESGKPIENAWAWPALAFEGRPSLGCAGLVGYFTMNGHKGRGLDPESLAKQEIRFKAASKMAQYHGWRRVFNVDTALRLVIALMGKDYKSKAAALAARKGRWTKTNHGGAYRRDIYANPRKKADCNQKLPGKTDRKNLSAYGWDCYPGIICCRCCQAFLPQIRG